MDEILELVNNHIDEVLNNPELLQKVCSYLNTSFALNKDNLKTNPNILKISDFIMPKIKEDPSIVLLFPYELMDDYSSNSYLREAAMNHFVPSFEQIKENPIIGKHLPIGILERLLRSEPRMIMYFPDEEFADHTKGLEFVATEEDLLTVPALRKIPGVMERTIEAHPELLKYLQAQIDDFVIYDALEQTILTREDFLANPYLCSVGAICEGPYELYDKHLPDERKTYIVCKLLSEGKYDEIRELPFFNHTLNSLLEEEVDIDKVIELVKVITPDLSKADDPAVNDENWKILSAIFDGIGAYRYRTKKNTFKFKSADVLIDRFERYFLEMNEENEDILMNILTNEIVDFMEATPEDDVELSVKISLYNIYKLYVENGRTMPDSGKARATITDICNYMLNFHRDKIIAKERTSLEQIINAKFALKPSKIRSILHSKKRDKVIRKIREYSATGNSAYEFFDRFRITLELRDIDPTLKDDKISEIYKHIVDTVVQTGKLDTDELYKYIENAIYGGKDDISEYLKYELKERTSYIIDIINKKINEEAKHIKLNELEAEITPRDRARFTSEFVPKNLSMTNKGATDFMLASLIVKLMEDRDRCAKATQEIDKRESLKRIIPFFGLIPSTKELPVKELSVDMLIDILAHYPRIERRINMDNGTKELEFSFEKLIGFATDYGMSSSLLRTIIDPTIVPYIGEHNVGKYAVFYLDSMFDRKDSTVPIVNGETGKYTYTSDFKDQDRMIIGKMYSDSCLDLNDSSGFDTFVECVAGPNGDVILIRDITSNELIGRVLAIRRGNLIQLQLRNLDGRINEDEYKILISEIGKQMMSASQEIGDNLEAIVIANPPHVGKRDDRLKTEFPHADWGGFYDMVIPEEDVEFDYKVPVKGIYHPPRQRLREQAFDQELSRMKAISIKMMPDSMHKEDLERNFEPVIFEGTGNQVILGEDFYIIHNNGEIIEEVVVPTKDTRQQIEISTVKERLGLSKGDGTHYG